MNLSPRRQRRRPLNPLRRLLIRHLPLRLLLKLPPLLLRTVPLQEVSRVRIRLSRRQQRNLWSVRHFVARASTCLSLSLTSWFTKVFRLLRPRDRGLSLKLRRRLRLRLKSLTRWLS